MNIKCTQCGTAANDSNTFFKVLITTLAIMLLLIGIAVLFTIPIVGIVIIIASGLMLACGSSKKLPKCKVCGGHTIPII